MSLDAAKNVHDAVAALVLAEAEARRLIVRSIDGATRTAYEMLRTTSANIRDALPAKLRQLDDVMIFTPGWAGAHAELDALADAATATTQAFRVVANTVAAEVGEVQPFPPEEGALDAIGKGVSDLAKDAGELLDDVGDAARLGVWLFVAAVVALVGILLFRVHRGGLSAAV